jgi:hypothetical protein
MLLHFVFIFRTGAVGQLANDNARDCACSVATGQDRKLVLFTMLYATVAAIIQNETYR